MHRSLVQYSGLILFIILVANCAYALSTDINRDGRTDMLDLQIIMGYLGIHSTSPAFNTSTDTVEDGVINLRDAVAVARNTIAHPQGGGMIALKTDRNIYAVPNVTKPAYLQPMTDPVFGTKITRITGDPGMPLVTKSGQVIGTWGDVVKHHYSRDQPWNADGSLLHLIRNDNGSPSDIFLDGETYSLLFTRTVPGEDNRWYPCDPNLKLYVSGNKLGLFNVRNGTNTVLRTFREYSTMSLGPWEGSPSFDGRWVVLYGNNTDVFAYDIDADTKYPVLHATGVDWASISPLGDYVVIKYSDTNTTVYDLNMNFILNFSVNENHFDLGIDQEGDEVAVGVSKGSPYSGRIIMHRLSDARLSLLTTGGYAIHTSMRNNLRPGWAYSSMHATANYPPYNDELVAESTDGSTVERWAHLHNVQIDYLSESHPVPSWDGRRVLFASDWGESDGRPVGVYVADAREQVS